MGRKQNTVICRLCFLLLSGWLSVFFCNLGKGVAVPGITVQNLKIHTDYLAGLRIRIVAREKEVQKCQKILQEKTRDLQTKTKRYKVMEKLKALFKK